MYERNQSHAADGRAITSGKPPRTTETLGCSADEKGRSSRTAARPLMVGTRLGPYEILDALGAGGMGPCGVQGDPA